MTVKDAFEQEYGYSYDYVMVFKVHDETAELSERQKEYSMKVILNRLSASGMCLITKQIQIYNDMLY